MKYDEYIGTEVITDENLFRPAASGKKIHSRDEFELCYIRHQYLRKVDYNPTEAEMEPYNKIISSISKNNAYAYKGLLHVLGFDIEDLMNISRIHLVSFLGLFSLEKNEKFNKEFVTAHKKRYKKDPSPEDFLDKNKANFTLFLKQRMGDLIRICRQKARNIKGLSLEEYQIFEGSENPPEDTNMLLIEPERYGFSKIDSSTFKKVKHITKVPEKKLLIGDKWYVLVPLKGLKPLTLADFSGAGLDPYDNAQNMTPEQILFHREEIEEFEEKKLSFEKKPDNVKARILQKFIDKNSNNPQYKQEVKLAKRYLRNIGE